MRAFASSDKRKVTKKASVKITGVPVEIPIQQLSNGDLERYRYTNLISWSDTETLRRTLRFPVSSSILRRSKHLRLCHLKGIQTAAIHSVSMESAH
jgi:hypothetical protein